MDRAAGKAQRELNVAPHWVRGRGHRLCVLREAIILSGAAVLGLSPLPIQAAGPERPSAPQEIGAPTAALDANGHVPVTELPSLSDAMATASNGKAARTIGAFEGDTLNAKNLGAMLDGSTGDAARIQALYDAAPNNAIIDVPVGRWPVVNGALFSPTKSADGKSVFWNLLGTLEAGPNAVPGTRPVEVIGDNDLTASFSGGHLTFARSIRSGGPGGPSLLVKLDNYSHSYVPPAGFKFYQAVPAFQVNVHSHPGSNGAVAGIESNVYSQGNNAFASEDLGLGISVTKLGQNSTWAISTQTQDNTGLPPGSFATVEAEMDILANGPDAAPSIYDPGKANRFMILLAAKPNPVAPYASNHLYSKGSLVKGAPNGGDETVFIAQTSGTTGATSPVWPASGTVTDGGVTWMTGVSYRSNVGTGIYLTGSLRNGSSYNTLIAANATIYNAGLDFSQIELAGKNAAAIRIGQNQPIDLSGNGTQANQNQHTLMYSESAGAVVYSVGGRPAFSVGNDFAVTGAGHDISTGPAPTATSGTLGPTATDRKGTITVGALSSVVLIMFHAAYTTPPDCIVTSPTGTTVASYTPTKTTLAITYAATAARSQFTYQCIQ